MSDFEYGPVELYIIGFSGERPGTGVVDAIVDLVNTDTIKLLDLVFARRSEDGALTILELEDVAAQYGFAGLAADELGLIGEHDVDELTETIAPGTSAALLIVEHLWARNFAETIYRADGRVLLFARIPAADVNAMIESIPA